MQEKKIIIGVVGFIGFNLARKLLEEKRTVIGIDNLNDYYNPNLKKDRLKILKKFDNFIFKKASLENYNSLDKIFDQYKPDKIINLAAQAGVRHSLENPLSYEKSNVLGFLNLLELMRKHQLKNLVFASSSSVCGGIIEKPFSEEMKIDKSVSLYAATKAANELYAHVYHNLFDINTIGLRFFTVYGPWGRPDMAYFSFTRAILEGKPIKVFNNGKMKRDFTYVDDIVDGICRAIDKTEKLKFEIFNLGCSDPVDRSEFINTIETDLGKTAKKEFLPLQSGGVPNTYADVIWSKKLLSYCPKTKIQEGIPKFIKWYKGDYQ